MSQARYFKVRIESDSVTLHDLAAYIGKDVTVFIVANEDAVEPVEATDGRLDLPFGIDRGKIEVAYDFDTLPDDLQAAFEGRLP